MRIHWLEQRNVEAGLAGRPIERPLRLATGLILFAYATSHLLNHAFGIRSVAAMEAASAVLLAPWQTYIGLTTLYTSFFIHGALGLRALYRRRHLRMPAGEAWQLGLGLAIPLLLIPHAGSVRIGSSAFGIDGGFDRVIYQFWVASPDFALPRQLLLLLVVWIHGCIGVRAWLASKPWYRRASAPLASLATLVPVVALLGFISAGLALRDAVHRDPSLAQHYAPAAPGSAAGQNAAALDWIVDGLVVAYLALVVGVFVLRAARDWHAKRFRALRITYPDQRVVIVPMGFSVLEASRWGEIPHESICGGRGRCSTCRVSIVAGAEWLAPPNPNERRTLDRIRAPSNVRLACQIRPSGDLSIVLLVPVATRAAATPARFDAAVEGGMELEIAAMFVDLRESTRLATGRLPYDALFLFDRYIQVVTGAVRKHSGHVTSVAGDGVMSVFGVHGNAASAARDAFRAANDLWSGLGSLNRELAAELGAPLRIGIGLHVGVSVVGLIATREAQALQFLGDTGNIAGKLEQQTKQLDCTMVASLAAVNLISPGARIDGKAIAIPGKEEPIDVVTFRDVRDLERLLASAPLV
jgi:adenylate cyclase